MKRGWTSIYIPKFFSPSFVMECIFLSFHFISVILPKWIALFHFLFATISTTSFMSHQSYHCSCYYLHFPYRTCNYTCLTSIITCSAHTLLIVNRFCFIFTLVLKGFLYFCKCFILILLLFDHSLSTTLLFFGYIRLAYFGLFDLPSLPLYCEVLVCYFSVRTMSSANFIMFTL